MSDETKFPVIQIRTKEDADRALRLLMFGKGVGVEFPVKELPENYLEESRVKELFEKILNNRRTSQQDLTSLPPNCWIEPPCWCDSVDVCPKHGKIP